MSSTSRRKIDSTTTNCAVFISKLTSGTCALEMQHRDRSATSAASELRYKRHCFATSAAGGFCVTSTALRCGREHSVAFWMLASVPRDMWYRLCKGKVRGQALEPHTSTPLVSVVCTTLKMNACSANGLFVPSTEETISRYDVAEVRKPLVKKELRPLVWYLDKACVVQGNILA